MTESNEELVAEELKRHMLLYEDKQLLKAREYTKIVRGFRARSAGTMILAAVFGVIQLAFLVLDLTMGPSEGQAPWPEGLNLWSRGFMLGACIVGFLFFRRDKRRCDRILLKLEQDAGSPT